MIERKEEFIEVLKKRLKETRFQHSLNVADAALRLAKKYGADEEKAYIAGLLHDVCKNVSPEEQKEYMLKDKEELDSVILENEKLWHAPAGAVYVRDVLGIKDEDIFLAIKYHTTARKNMGLLEKIIYIADYISDERSYEGVEIMREKAFRDLDEAILEGTRYTILDLAKANRIINQDTIDAYNEMSKKFERVGIKNI